MPGTSKVYRLAQLTFVPILVGSEALWFTYGDLRDQLRDWYAGLAVMLAAVALVGCVFPFLRNDPHRWRWLRVFGILAILTSAGAAYLLSHDDVDRVHALALGGMLGVMLLVVAASTRRSVTPARSP